MDTKIKIIDTHCHPQFSQYDTDRDEVIRHALDAGVGMICVGVDLESSRQAVALSDRYEGLWASVGLHPNDPGEVDGFESLLTHTKVVAVGEVGLDYYRSSERKEEQKKRLKKFIDLATKYNKPLIIHCRDAHEDMLAMISGRGVIHSFTGTIDQARVYVERGFYIGLNGIVTFADSYKEMVRSVPLDRILLETDAPYLAPTPYRGKRNQPAYAETVGESIAAIRGEESSMLFEATTRNAKALLNIID